MQNALKLVAVRLGWLLMRPFFRYRIEGLHNLPSQGVLLALNHTSLVDAPLVWVAFRGDIRFLATQGLFVPPLSWLLGIAGCIPVNRHAPGQRSAHARMFVRVNTALKNNERVGIFPEGGINTGVIKRGIVTMAKNGDPVVPVVLRGARGSFPWRREVTITIHAPIRNAGDEVRTTLAELFANP